MGKGYKTVKSTRWQSFISEPDKNDDYKNTAIKWHTKNHAAHHAIEGENRKAAEESLHPG